MSLPKSGQEGKGYRERTQLVKNGLHTGGLTLTLSLMNSCLIFWGYCSLSAPPPTWSACPSRTQASGFGSHLEFLVPALGLVLLASAPRSGSETPKLALSHVVAPDLLEPSLHPSAHRPCEYRSTQQLVPCLPEQKPSLVSGTQL